MYAAVDSGKVHWQKTGILFLLLSFTTSFLYSQSGLIDTSKIKGHPRLLLPAGGEEAIKNNIATNPTWQKVHNDIIAECDLMLDMPPIEKEMIGRRMLGKSRDALRRIFFLSYAWRTTAKKAYFKKAEKELLAAAKFNDWNPSHYLDVGEMSLAVAIGYDWLYNDLSPASRQTICDALITKGINTSLDEKHKDNWWLRGTNNWGQVCNTGIAFAATAVYETQPAVSKRIIERSIKSIRNPMQVYAPDGNYAEGYAYWAYGTSFNVLMISMLEQLFGSDYGLSKEPGFLKTAAYYEQMVGPSGKPFNYSDCGVNPDGLQPAMLWFADKQKDYTLLWQEKLNLQQGKTMAKFNRLLPAAMIWGKDLDMNKVTAPAATTWVGDGENPVALMRTSWSNNSIYVGFKGGTASTSHAHMDIGSFAMDAEGVRWSGDLGMQGYESMESKGLKIWDMTQESDRWKVFRYGNFSHSTLTVNNALQNMKGRAPITKHGNDSLFTHAVVDLGQIYKGQLVKAERGIAIVNKQYVTVRDELETGDSTCTIRWAMLTPAKVASINKNQMLLTNGGKKLTLYVNGLPENAVLQTWTTDPPNSYDELNLGTVLVGFEVIVPAHTKTAFNVFLLPGEGQVSVKKSSLKPLIEW